MKTSVGVLRKNNMTAQLCLRLGLAFVFGYATFAGLQHPDEWASFLPQMLTDHIEATALLHVFEAYQVGLVLWLLSGKYVRYAALLSALTFAGIIMGNPHDFETTFRDIGLLFAALALVWIEE
jgi:hypothetical protein